MDKKKEIFESMPVPKALASLAIPTILSQLVTMIYNLADTLYIGQTGNPYMVAGVSLSFPLFFIITAIANLIGIGGGSLISRMLGAKRPEEAKRISSFGFWTGIVLALIYSIIILFVMNPLLLLLGASANTLSFAKDYTFWVIIVGGVPTAISSYMAHFLRSEGFAKQSSIGIAGGGILNIILDPIFIFPLNMAVKGAAIATMLSNVASMIYFFYVIYRMRGRTVLSISPKNYRLPWAQIKQILSVGFPAAVATLLVCLSATVINKLSSSYGDIALAAFGIVKKIDMIPMSVSMGLSQGMLPLMAYNYAAKNYDRMHSVSNTGRTWAIGFSLICIAVFQLIPSFLVRLFIPDPDTIALGTIFLRIACLAVPVMQMNFLLNTTFQAMGKGTQSLILSVCRQGLFNIPLLFLMNYLAGLYGIIWTQLIADSLTLVISLGLYSSILKRLRSEAAEYAELESKRGLSAEVDV